MSPSALDFLLERRYQFPNASDNLAMPLVNIHTYLRNQGVGGGKLRNGQPGDGELADAYDSDSKLRDGQNTAGELTHRNNASRHHGRPIGAVLERDVNQRQAKDVQIGFVLKPPSIPFVLRWVWGSTTWAHHGLLRHFMLACSAWLHLIPLR